MTISVSLSKLVCSRENVRRVKPERDAHRRMVASIKAFGLFDSLLVRKVEGEDRYEVINGERRLAALRVVHRGKNPKIPCTLKKVEDDKAEAMSLSANFTQERTHPLDEAEAFARQASKHGKDVDEIAAEFGVNPHYIRQRMKLAGLAEPIKEAYRARRIDTATAEVFASVPTERQEQVWQELRGEPRNAQQVRTVIEEAWIDAGRAMFDTTTLPPSAISSDLFSERVLIEREAFMAAQGAALAVKQTALSEEGWNEVVIAQHGEVHDRLYKMDQPQPAYDAKTTKKLQAIDKRRGTLEEQESDDADAFDALDREEEELIAGVEVFFDEATKAHGTAFLLLDPDGRVRTEYRLPRKRDGRPETPKSLTSAELSDGQLAAVFTHEAIAVREAVADHPLVLKRLLVIALHDHVQSDGIAIRHAANVTTGNAERGGMCQSDAYEARQRARKKADPLAAQPYVSDVEAYEAVAHFNEAKLDRLIETLTVQLLTGQPARATPLISLLRNKLSVDIRKHWRPTAEWLAGYKKCQLAHLLGELRGQAFVPAAEKAKKSELVETLATLFADAQSRRMADVELAAKVNAWVPSPLQQVTPEAIAEAA